jgi:hypothetical protein
VVEVGGYHVVNSIPETIPGGYCKASMAWAVYRRSKSIRDGIFIGLATVSECFIWWKLMEQHGFSTNEGINK